MGVGDPLRIVNGLPMWGEPMPWKTTPETPNLGKIDATDDQRPGLGFAGLDHLRQFVEQGGLLVAVEDTAQLMIATGMAPGVRVTNSKNLKVVGSVLDARFPDPASPIVDGLGDRLSVYSAEGMSFELSNSAVGRLGPGGRATVRPAAAAPRTPTPRRAAPPSRRGPRRRKSSAGKPGRSRSKSCATTPAVIPEALRPRTVVRFGDADDLLVSGLLENGGELARRAAVVEVPVGKGHLLLFAINPIWRGSTIGSHPLVWNAILQ